MDRPGQPRSRPIVGADVDNATLPRLPDRSRPADLARKAPADLATRHAQLFHTATRAHDDGRNEAAERTWRQADGPVVQAQAASSAALGLLQYAA
jgi:hypothetical protein